MRELACEYNGYYKQIESKNNVQNNVMVNILFSPFKLLESIFLDLKTFVRF